MALTPETYRHVILKVRSDRNSPMKKMILMLKLAKKNTALALSTVFGRVIWP
jgi:hypothetical protein